MIIDKSEELSYKGNTGTACVAGMHSLQENHEFTSDFSEIRFYQSVEVLCRSLVFCLFVFLFLFLLVVWSVLLRFTASEYPFGIFNEM
jgi:hypothetical protein